MSNYNTLKATINANIKQNGNQEITGQILNSVLNQMVTTLGAGYQFAGVATLDPATDPGTPDAKVFYIANGKGTYTNFGGVSVTEDDVVVLYWDSSWHKLSTGIASQAKLTELEGQADAINTETIAPESILSGYIDYTTGATGSSVNFIQRHYRAKNVTKILCDSLYSRDGVPAFIAFFNGIPSTDTYMKNESIKASSGYHKIETKDIPADAEWIVVSNRDADNPEPNIIVTIKVDVVGNLEVLEHKVASTNTQEVMPDNIFAGYILYSTGESELSSNCVTRYYKIENLNLLKCDSLYSSDTQPALVAYFNGEPSAETYMKDASVRMNTGYNKVNLVDFPEDAVWVAVCNRDSDNPNPVIIALRPINVVGNIKEINRQLIYDVTLPKDAEFTIDVRLYSGNITAFTGYIATEGYYYFPKGSILHVVGYGFTGYSMVSVYNESKVYESSVINGAGYSTKVDEYYTFEDDKYARFAFIANSVFTIEVEYNGVVFKLNQRLKKVESDIAEIEGIKEWAKDLILPSYAEDEIARVYNRLVGITNKECCVVAFNTDQHYDIDEQYAVPTHVYNPVFSLNGIKAIKKIADKYPLDMVVLGGDTAGYGGQLSSSVDGIIKEVNMLIEPLKEINSVVVSIPGNHDCQNASAMTAQGVYNICGKLNSKKYYFVHSGADNCDAYIDDNEHKIRNIFVDQYSTNGRTENVNTFLSNALSTMPEGFSALIFSHCPLTNEFDGVVMATNVSEGTQTNAFFGVSDKHSILNPYADRIIACICGHSHMDAWGVSSSGILYIETTCAAPHTRGYDFESIPYACTLNSVTDTSFDFFVIDQNDKTIEAIRYGQGCDRKWRYKGMDIGQMAGYPKTIVR